MPPKKEVMAKIKLQCPAIEHEPPDVEPKIVELVNIASI